VQYAASYDSTAYGGYPSQGAPYWNGQRGDSGYYMNGTGRHSSSRRPNAYGASAGGYGPAGAAHQKGAAGAAAAGHGVAAEKGKDAPADGTGAPKKRKEKRRCALFCPWRLAMCL
jgi:hypothetical protein